MVRFDRPMTLPLAVIYILVLFSFQVDVMISLVFLYSMFKLGKSEYAGTDRWVCSLDLRGSQHAHSHLHLEQSVLRKLMIMSFQVSIFDLFLISYILLDFFSPSILASLLPDGFSYHDIRVVCCYCQQGARTQRKLGHLCTL